MTEFNQRWQKALEQARGTVPDAPVAPAGFATRVIARRRATAKGDEIGLWSDAWLRLCTRTLAGAFAVLVVMVALEWHDAKSRSMGFPHLERTVAQAFWIL